MKRLYKAAAAVLTLLVCAVMMSAGKKPAAEPEAYILIEADTGTVLDEKNSKELCNVGYLSKLMSLLLIAEDIETGKYSVETVLTASQSVYGTKGSVVWLEPRDSMTVEELLKSVIIGNANDALTVLAEASEGSVDKFVMRMNAEAFDLGLRNTAFFSPYGFYDEREHTTAAELAVICSRLVHYEKLRPYFRTWRDFVRNGAVELVSENSLTRTYSPHIGLKAAHSEASGYCIAEAAMSEEGVCYISLVLGAEDEDSSHKTAKKLCKKGFNEFKVTATMFPDEMLMPVKVKKGIDTAAGIRLKNQSALVIPKGAGELRTVTVLPQYLTAPVRRGQVIGCAAFYNGKTLVYESEIVAADNIGRLDCGYAFRKMLLNLLE
jgi:D-alanyl-D-alanine carboxypeptidase (penicillin-binding protein 5/6)